MPAVAAKRLERAIIGLYQHGPGKTWWIKERERMAQQGTHIMRVLSRYYRMTNAQAKVRRELKESVKIPGNKPAFLYPTPTITRFEDGGRHYVRLDYKPVIEELRQEMESKGHAFEYQLLRYSAQYRLFDEEIRHYAIEIARKRGLKVRALMNRAKKEGLIEFSKN